MSQLTPEVRRNLAAYLEFQHALGIDRVRMAPLTPDELKAGRVAPPGSPARLRAGAEREAPRQDIPLAADASGAGKSASSTHAPAPGLEVLDDIRRDIGPDCRRCKLHQARHSIVFGDGDLHAELVFVGEGPGADEDAQGLPFVGRGGQLLNDMIQKGMGLRRDQVYICNVVKCRPPGNRTPEADEIEACSPFLWRQLAAIRPRIVCALGATAAQVLHPYRGSLTSVRGVIHPLHLGPGGTGSPEDAGGFESKLVITYHPAYLLRDPSRKRDTWMDLQLIMAELGLERPAAPR